jgi:hypothetical protein
MLSCAREGSFTVAATRRRTVLVVVSASSRAVSADRRLTKPFDLDVLLRAVRELGGSAAVA